MIEIGIAGCGWAGKRHYEAVRASDRARVAAIADADEETRAQRETSWEVDHAVAEYADLWDRPDLDAAIVALPHHLHEDAVVCAANAGLDVLCEKPIARTIAEADAMIDAAETEGTALVVAESARYEPWVRTVEDAVAAGAVGTPVFCTYNWLHDFGGYRYERSAWLNDPDRLGGGSWLLNGIHIVSALRGWWEEGSDTNAVESVFAREHRPPEFDAPPGIEANVHATLAFEDGTTAAIDLGLAVDDHDEFDDVRLVGTDGSIRVPDGSDRVERYRGDTAEPTVRDVPDGDAFEQQFEAFLDTIETSAESRTPAVRERDSLAVVRAGYDSIGTEGAVAVDTRS